MSRCEIWESTRGMTRPELWDAMRGAHAEYRAVKAAWADVDDRAAALRSSDAYYTFCCLFNRWRSAVLRPVVAPLGARSRAWEVSL